MEKPVTAAAQVGQTSNQNSMGHVEKMQQVRSSISFDWLMLICIQIYTHVEYHHANLAPFPNEKGRNISLNALKLILS